MRPARRHLPALTVLAILAIATLVIAGCGSKSATAGQVQVVAAENFWGSIASQIGGGHVHVTSIITDPNADPHQYASNASNAAAVAKSKVVIVNGVGYDTFMNDLLNASGAHPDVVTVQTVLGVTGTDANPHLWYDIPRIPTIAHAIAHALAKADPPDSHDFTANETKFDDSLRPITTVIHEIKTKYPGAPVAYTERVPGYLLADAGLDVKTPTGFASSIEDGNDPSPGDTQAMDALITGHHIKVLLYNVQTVSSVTESVKSLAKSAGIPVVGVSETLPSSATTYQQWQLDQVTALLHALER